MPWRARGVWTQVKRGSRWVNLKRHSSHTAAVKHARAANINYHEKRGVHK